MVSRACRSTLSASSGSFFCTFPCSLPGPTVGQGAGAHSGLEEKEGGQGGEERRQERGEELVVEDVHRPGEEILEASVKL